MLSPSGFDRSPAIARALRVSGAYRCNRRTLETASRLSKPVFKGGHVYLFFTNELLIRTHPFFEIQILLQEFLDGFGSPAIAIREEIIQGKNTTAVHISHMY
jgi:hypothetical protein